MAIDIETNKKYAIKIMKDANLDSYQMEYFLNECKIMASLKSKNVIKLIHVSMDGNYRKADGRTFKVTYYVMKIAEFGELFNIIEETPKFPEKIARYYFRQLLNGKLFNQIIFFLNLIDNLFFSSMEKVYKIYIN